jgi:dihydroorotate dehydrogenase (fumarate)
MNLETTYMGFKLEHPIVPGASPMVDDLDLVKRLEDAGAPMIVMHSLFEEQLVGEEVSMMLAVGAHEEAHSEARSYLPEHGEFVLGAHEYLEQIRKIKETVSVPVIASLNGITQGGWLRYAKFIEDAGADGLELNLYELAMDPEETGAGVEARSLRIVRTVAHSIGIPVAVKLSPFYSSIANFALRLEESGARALVLFNRFYQPDIDVDALEMFRVHLSSPNELLLRLRWIGALSGRIHASLAATGGVHSAIDVVKAVMAGAHAVQMVSALLAHGPKHLAETRRALSEWLEAHEYDSLEQMRGSMSLERCTNPKAYERANYVRVLQSWTGAI